MAREALQLAPEADAPPEASPRPGRWREKGRSLGNEPLRPRERLAARLRLPVLNRPTNRSECRDGPRPCPWVGCRFHLYLDVREDGAPKVNFPGLEQRDDQAIAERFALLMFTVQVASEGTRRIAKVRVGRIVLTAAGETKEEARERLAKKLRLLLEEEETELDLSPLEHTCALDVADQGPRDLEELGRLFNVTMERARQYEEEALDEANARGRREGWADRNAPERLQRIHRAATRRRATPLEEHDVLGPRGPAGRSYDAAPCPRCGRCVGPAFASSRFTHATHRAPGGRWCRGDERMPDPHAAGR